MPKAPSAETTVHADHEVIKPPTNLKAYAHQVIGDGLDEEALERADEAIAALEGEFAGWMQTEVDHLCEARRNIGGRKPSAEDMQVLYRAAHDIRGQGVTFGFPLAGDIADNLCNYIDAMPHAPDASLEFVDAHIDAIAAVLREDVRDRSDPTARAVLWGLTEARKRFAPDIEPVIRTADGQPV